MSKNRLSQLGLFLVMLLFPFCLRAGIPQLELSETSWDWGRVPQNSVVYHTFWLKNTGTDTLRFLNVRVA